MDKFIKLLALLIGMTAIFFAGAAEKVPPSGVKGKKAEQQALTADELRIVPVEPTPESSVSSITIVFPREEVVTKSPVYMEVRVFSYPLGTNTDHPRAKEVFNDPAGQGLHVFLDNEPYFYENEGYITANDNNQEYYIQYMNFPLPEDLKEGAHTLRAITVRSYNESLKSPDTMAATTFYVNSKKNGFIADLSQPYLVYNEPQGDYDYSTTQPVLLDFALVNAQLSRDGYKVRLTIDGKTTSERIISNHVPYYIYGLREGSHTFRLQLLDPDGHQVPGAFNDVTRKIQVKS